MELSSKTKSQWKKRLTYLSAFLFCAIGILHFLQPAPFIEIVPAYVPWPAQAVYLSGFFEILGGIGLIIPRLRKSASISLFCLLVAVFPANINMAVNKITFGVPLPILWFRLPFQFLFMAWVWWIGRD